MAVVIYGSSEQLDATPDSGIPRITSLRGLRVVFGGRVTSRPERTVVGAEGRAVMSAAHNADSAEYERLKENVLAAGGLVGFTPERAPDVLVIGGWWGPRMVKAREDNAFGGVRTVHVSPDQFRVMLEKLAA